MSYQTYHPVTGTTVVPIGRHSESGQSSSETTDNESSPLYPFGKPVFLSGLPVQMGIVNLNYLKVSNCSNAYSISFFL